MFVIFYRICIFIPKRLIIDFTKNKQTLVIYVYVIFMFLNVISIKNEWEKSVFRKIYLLINIFIKIVYRSATFS